MASLAGLGVLVTRPESQAGPLAQRLEAEGARVFLLPALAVRASADRPALRAALGPIDRYDWVVYVSANAVRHGAFLLDTAPARGIVAVGPATAAALAAAGHPVALVPQGGYDTEHLLGTPEFHAVARQRVLIVRGDGGRELMGDELRSRAAEVTYAEVYRRCCAEPVPGAVRAVEAAWAAGAIHVVTATSTELLRCLYEILGPDGRARLQAAVLLTGGLRIAEAARAMGHGGERVVAGSADDASLVDALREWRRHTERP